MDNVFINASGVITPKEWTVNSNGRHDYSLTANTVYNEWLDAQGK
jgi:hypothetical protein